MKKSDFIYSIFVCFLLFTGCTHEESYVPSRKPEQRPELTDDALAILDIYSTGNFEITEEEAIERAKAAISNPDLNPSTRTADGELHVKEVVPLTSENFVVDAKPKTEFIAQSGKVVEVELPEVLGYAVNFTDNTRESAGFVIVPADKRIDHVVLATVPSGSLPATAEEEVTNDGVAFFLDNTEDYAVWCIAEAERKADSLKQSIIAEYQPLYPGDTIEVEFNETGPETRNSILFPRIQPFTVTAVTTVVKDWYEVSKVEPLVPVEWGQGAPFNTLVKSKRKCNNAVTGCVTTATAQLMTYWEYPRTIGNLIIDWDSIRLYTGYKSWQDWENKPYNKWLGTVDEASDRIKNQTAYLMKHIGESIGASYHCSNSGCKYCGGGGTSAKTENAVGYLKKSGYTCSTVGWPYKFNLATSSLRSGRPVLISGKSSRVKHKFLGITIWSSYKGGHAWIIDGYKQRQRVVKTVTTYKLWNKVLKTKTSVHTQTDDLLHNNWGWEGISNGYFTAGVFDSRNAVQTSDGTVTRGTDYYYRYQIKIWPNIHK